PGFGDQRGGVGVGAAGFGGGAGGEALVDEVGGAAGAAGELGGEAAGALGHLGFGAVHVEGQADQQTGRVPFGDELGELRPVGFAVAGAQRRDGARGAGDGLAGGDADVAQAEV